MARSYKRMLKIEYRNLVNYQNDDEMASKIKHTVFGTGEFLMLQIFCLISLDVA